MAQSPDSNPTNSRRLMRFKCLATDNDYRMLLEHVDSVAHRVLAGRGWGTERVRATTLDRLERWKPAEEPNLRQLCAAASRIARRVAVIVKRQASRQLPMLHDIQAPPDNCPDEGGLNPLRAAAFYADFVSNELGERERELMLWLADHLARRVGSGHDRPSIRWVTETYVDELRTEFGIGPRRAQQILKAVYERLVEKTLEQ